MFNTSIGPDLYNVAFRYVGQGNGNYKQLLSGTNGRVYQWVAPINNIKQGEFDPGSFIPTPKLQQLITASFKIKLSQHCSFISESAMSYNDVNLFSNLDINNKTGWATKISVFDTLRRIKILSRENQLIVSFASEFIQKAYKPIERLRNVEFLRDWNLAVDNVPSNETFSTLTWLLNGKKNNFIKSETKFLKKENNYEGWKQLFNWNFKSLNWTLNSTINNLTFKNTINEGVFFRPSFLVNKKWFFFHDIESGIVASGEFNKVTNRILDTLNSQSFALRKIEGFVKSTQDKANKWEVHYFNFVNWYPGKQDFIKSDESNNYFLQAQLLSSQSNQCLLNIGYRDYKVQSQYLSNQKDDQSLLGRLEYRFIKWNNLINGNVFYETGSGQEQKKEFAFIQVPVGQGNYFWIDYNNNGIEELNEFEIAIFQDQKNYIKIYAPSNIFIKSNFVNFNYDVTFRFEQFLKNNSARLLNYLKKIEYNSSLQLEKKKQASGDFFINPFKQFISDSGIILNNTSFIQNVFFNRMHSKWGFDFFEMSSATKSLLTYGFEKRFTQTRSLKFRYNFEKKYQFNLLLKNTKNELATNGMQFGNRNYKIYQKGIHSNMTYTLKSKFRFTIGFELIEKKNKIDSMDLCKMNNVNLELKYNVLSSASITARISKNDIRFSTYKGGERTTVGFIMLDGLSIGSNYLFNLDFTKKLGARFECNLQYEGRSNSINQFIHIGRTSIRAIF